MAKLKFNGSKKYIGIYSLLIAIFIALLKVLGSVHAQGVETGTLKTRAATNSRRVTENKLFIEQETSRLEITKVNRDLFRAHEQVNTEQFDRIEAGMETQRKERREDTKQIMELIKNGH